ncbi:MAG: Clp protease N-terminal domain-containing protein, partial [Deinococcus sp.]
MNPDRLTESALEALATAQQLAQGAGQQQLTVTHLLRTLLDQGAAAGALTLAGGELTAIRADLDAELDKLPRVQGAGGQLYADPALGRALSAAEGLAAEFGDSFVAADVLLLALRPESRLTSLPTLAALREAVTQQRKGKTVTSKTSESQFDALNKYGLDLTQRAREGKLDPVIGRDEEIRRVMQILLRRTKNNPV